MRPSGSRRAAIALAWIASLSGLSARAGESKAIALIERVEAWVGNSYASATKALGAPIRTTREVRDNLHDESLKNEVITLSYSWGEVTVLRAMIGTPDERELLDSLVARSSIPRLPGIPKFGTDRASIVEDLGPPEDESPNTVRFIRENGEAQPESLTFRFVDDRLTEIVWAFGVD
jgi:hypothetical protein